MKIYITDLAYCPRKAFFSYFYKPKRYYSYSYENKIHKIILNKLEQDGYDIEVPVSLRVGEFKLVGRVDAVADDHIVEVKTVKEFDFKVKDYWLAQVNMYMHILNLSKAKLIIVERSTGNVFSTNINYNQEKALCLLDVAYQVVDAIKSKNFKNLPKQTENCAHCSFNIICNII